MSLVVRHAASRSSRLEVVCSGSPREMGLAQGAALREKVWAAREALERLEAFRLEQPCWLPFSVFRWLAILWLRHDPRPAAMPTAAPMEAC